MDVSFLKIILKLNKINFLENFFFGRGGLLYNQAGREVWACLWIKLFPRTPCFPFLPTHSVQRIMCPCERSRKWAWLWRVSYLDTKNKDIKKKEQNTHIIWLKTQWIPQSCLCGTHAWVWASQSAQKRNWTVFVYLSSGCLRFPLYVWVGGECPDPEVVVLAASYWIGAYS